MIALIGSALAIVALILGYVLQRKSRLSQNAERVRDAQVKTREAEQEIAMGDVDALVDRDDRRSSDIGTLRRMHKKNSKPIN